MRLKTLFVLAFFLSAFFLSAQTTEVKGLVTFKTIKKNLKTNVPDTIVEKGKYTMITLFNKMDSKIIAISDSTGYYYFLLDKETAEFTHVQFYNDYGVYEVYPVTELKQPFHDVVLVKDETIPQIKEVSLTGHDIAVERMSKLKEKEKKKKTETETETGEK